MMNFRLPLSKERDEIGGSYYKHRKVFAVTCNLDQKIKQRENVFVFKRTIAYDKHAVKQHLRVLLTTMKHLCFHVKGKSSVRIVWRNANMILIGRSICKL